MRFLLCLYFCNAVRMEGTAVGSAQGPSGETCLLWAGVVAIVGDCPFFVSIP